LFEGLQATVTLDSSGVTFNHANDNGGARFAYARGMDTDDSADVLDPFAALIERDDLRYAFEVVEKIKQTWLEHCS